MAGSNVRLAGDQAANTPQATTADDGYFRIPFSAPTVDVSKAPNAAIVEVFEPSGRLAYSDPLPLQLDSGGAYR